MKSIVTFFAILATSLLLWTSVDASGSSVPSTFSGSSSGVGSTSTPVPTPNPFAVLSCNASALNASCISTDHKLRITGKYWRALLTLADFPTRTQAALEASLRVDILLAMMKHSVLTTTTGGASTTGGGSSGTGSATTISIDLVQAYNLKVRVTSLGLGSLLVGFAVDSGVDAQLMPDTSIVAAIEGAIRDLVNRGLSPSQNGGAMAVTELTYRTALESEGIVANASDADPVLILSVSNGDDTGLHSSPEAGCGSLRCQLAIGVAVLILIGVAVVIVLLVISPCCKNQPEGDDGKKEEDGKELKEREQGAAAGQSSDVI